MHRIWFVLSVLFYVPACCPATVQAGPEHVPTAPAVLAPQDEPPAPETTSAEEACGTPPDVACCRALTPECEACQAESAQRAVEYEARCGSPSDIEPVPDTFDCTVPPPLVACCRALLPRCTACAARNRAVEAAWQAACAKGDVPPPAEVTP